MRPKIGPFTFFFSLLLDTTDAAAVKAVFDSIDEAVETINVSFVMTSAK